MTRVIGTVKVAEMLCVTRKTVNNWVLKGYIKPVGKTAGGHMRYSEQDILRMQENLREGFKC